MERETALGTIVQLMENLDLMPQTRIQCFRNYPKGQISIEVYMNPAAPVDRQLSR